MLRKHCLVGLEAGFDVSVTPPRRWMKHLFVTCADGACASLRGSAIDRDHCKNSFFLPFEGIWMDLVSFDLNTI